MKTLSKSDIINLIHHKVERRGIELSNCGSDKQGVYHFIVDRHDDYDKLDNLISLLRNYSETYIHDLVSVVFTDEYISCDDCGMIIRTTPAYYGDLPDYYIDDNGASCGDCVRKHPEYYLDYLDNNPRSGNTILDESVLTDNGYAKINSDSYESGFHPGQNDDPKKIFADLKTKYSHIIFNLDGAGQFDVSFSVWAKNE